MDNFSQTSSSLGYNSVSFGGEDILRHYGERTVTAETSQLVSSSSPVGQFARTMGLAGEFSEVATDATDNFAIHGNTPRAYIATTLDYLQQTGSGFVSYTAGGVVGTTTGTLTAMTGWGLLSHLRLHYQQVLIRLTKLINK
ncbi:hypothetical protein C9J45_12670 [Photobacterium sp. GB-1]|nr:hypothetical protein C9J45_12670 [Photobacterium sp. GB-1]